MKKRGVNHSFGYSIVIPGIVLGLTLYLGGCQSGSDSTAQPQQSPTVTREESRLTLNNATLEQSNSEGETLWKIQVEEVVYSQDRKKAELKNIKANIFQKGKLVLKVSGDRGQIYKGGEEVFLRQNIIAVDPRNKAVIHSQEVEWNPKESVLIVRGGIKGKHEKFEASAKSGKYYTKAQQLELNDDIVGIGRDPKLHLKGKRIIWNLPQQAIVGEQGLTLSRYEDKTLVDEVKVNRAEILLNKKWVWIHKAINYKSLDPPLKIVTQALSWDYQNRIVVTQKPVQLVHEKDQITLTGNTAKVDLGKNLAFLENGVQGIGLQNQSKLYANTLLWHISSQILEATGDIVYEQGKPKLNLTGERAVGTLQTNNIVVTSNKPERVVTEIFP